MNGADGGEHHVQGRHHDAVPARPHAEAWYDNAAAYEETVTTPAWRALFDHGTTVFDPSSMVHGIVDEHVLRDGPRDGGSVKATWTVQPARTSTRRRPAVAGRPTTVRSCSRRRAWCATSVRVVEHVKR